MEYLVAGLLGVVVALALLRVIWAVVSAAVDNVLDWLVHTFGNERAAQQIEEKRRARGHG